MDGAVKKRKQSTMMSSPDQNAMIRGAMRGISDTGLPTAEEALAKYYRRMSKLEKKLNQKLED